MNDTQNIQDKEFTIHDFGIKLSELRKNKKMSQSALARKLGLHRNTVSKYEANTLTPSVEVLIDIANFFNVSADYLLGIEKREILFIGDVSPEHKEYLKKALVLFKESFPYKQ